MIVPHNVSADWRPMRASRFATPRPYAAGLGLPAPKDTLAIEAIFGDVDTAACTETFAFGKEGKPFCVSGPNDTPARVHEIIPALGRSRTTGDWDYLVEVPAEPALLTD